jgi:hypothetical protein
MIPPCPGYVMNHAAPEASQWAWASVCADFLFCLCFLLFSYAMCAFYTHCFTKNPLKIPKKIVKAFLVISSCS